MSSSLIASTIVPCMGYLVYSSVVGGEATSLRFVGGAEVSALIDQRPSGWLTAAGNRARFRDLLRDVGETPTRLTRCSAE